MGIMDPNNHNRKFNNNKNRVRGTPTQLIFGIKNPEPNFSRILPSKMKELLTQGLFVENGRDAKNQLTYKITPLGRKLLAQLESSNAPAP